MKIHDNLIKKVMYVSLLIFTLGFPSYSAEANGDDEGNGLGYTVRAVRPSTQLDDRISSFLIKTEPGVPQKLEIKIKSVQKEEIPIVVYTQNAITNSIGAIEYTDDIKKIDNTLNLPITSLTSIEQENFTIGNYEEKTIVVNVVPPKDAYDGIKLGSIAIMRDSDDNDSNPMKTEVGYNLGLAISSTGEDYNDGLSLELNSAKALLKNGKKVVIIELKNPEPKLLENLSMEVTLTDKKSGSKIKEKKVDGYRLAPNSILSMELDWGIQDMPSGEYLVEVKAENSYKNWDLKTNLSISNEQAKKINKDSPYKIVTPTWVKIISVCLLIYLVANSIYMVYRRHKWKVRYEKLSRTKKNKKRGTSKRRRG